MLPFLALFCLLGLTSVLGAERHGNWAWLLVFASWVLPVGDAVECQVAYYVWTLARQLRDGQSPLRMLTLLPYVWVLPEALAVQLFVMMVPLLVSATLGVSDQLLILATLPWLPWFFWHHGWASLGQPWWVGLAFWLRIVLWQQPLIKAAQ